ncbi:MAG: restriction endonuclease subunit S [Acutalibacteraceae bacterium]|nr:restriction endonuclease subunit S [Acutalibacteraceae bacterium]
MKVTTQLKDIVSFSKGEQIKGSDLLEEGPYDYLNGGITPSGKWNRYNTPKNTVTVSEGGNSCGYVNYMDRPFWCGAHCYYLFNSKLDNKYLYYALKSQQNRLMKIRSGACMPNIKKSDLGAFKLTYETNELEQKEIVKRLDKVKLVIDLRKAELQQLDELVKSRFVEMFGTLNINEKNYTILAISDLCTLIKDGTHQTPTYTEDIVNGFKFLSSKDVMSQKINWNNIKYIPAELHEKLYSTIQPKKNDILMSKNGVNYGVAAVNDTDEVFDIYVSLALLRPRTEKINPVYLRCVINNLDTKRQFDGSIKGIGVPNLHLSEIKKTKILVPPIEKQNDFVAFVEQVDKSKFCVTNYLRKIQLIKGELL